VSYTLYQGDCLDVLRGMDANSVDTVITDPPAGIAFMNKTWDSDKGGTAQWIAWLTEVMREALRVTKPGGMALVWSIPRTSHWTGTAIEAAGWEVRDVITHLFGSGFPKSLAIDKAIDKMAGAKREVIGESPYNARRPNEGETGNSTYTQGGYKAYITAPATDDAATWQGYGTALKPAAEFWWLAMKPLDGTFAQNALTWGVAGLNVDGARIGVTDAAYQRNASGDRGHDQNRGRQMDYAMTAGHANSIGRWPANVVLDEDAAELLDEQSGMLTSGRASANGHKRSESLHDTANGWGMRHSAEAGELYGDTGGASRFFYVAKAARSERDAGLAGMAMHQVDESREPDAPGANNPRNRGGRTAANFHPTVKPVELMRYLCRLTKTPTGGTVLDPFMGSGTTGVACVLEGRRFVGIDLDPHYCAIAERRIAMTQPALLGGAF
jgi:hypothetical protein